MARVTGIGGVFFKSRTDRSALAAWYRDHLGVALQDELEEGALGAAAAVGERLVRQHQAMAQHVGGEVAHVIGQHVVAAAQERERAGALDQVDRRARAGAVSDIGHGIFRADGLGVAGCGHDANGVFDQRGIDIDLGGLLLQNLGPAAPGLFGALVLAPLTVFVWRKLIAPSGLAAAAVGAWRPHAM